MKAVAVVTFGGVARAADAMVVSRHKTMGAARAAATRLRMRLDRAYHDYLGGGPFAEDLSDSVAAEWADDFVDSGGTLLGGYVRRADPDK